MGIYFRVGKPTPTYKEDFDALRRFVQHSAEARIILDRLEERVEYDLGLSDTNWEDPDSSAPEPARWSYRGFMRFRKRIAAIEGIDLDRMWGFGPESDFQAYRVMHPGWKLTGENARQADGAMDQFYAEHIIKWEQVNTPLEPFLHHSDCDGEMTPEECAQVVPRLRECMDALAAESGLDDYDVENGMFLVAQMDYCALNGYHLLFR